MPLDPHPLHPSLARASGPACQGSAASGTCELPALLTQIISPPVLGTVCSAQTHFKEAALQQECFKKYNISICYSNSICCGSLLTAYLPFFAPIRCKNHLIRKSSGLADDALNLLLNSFSSPAGLLRSLGASPERKVQVGKQLFPKGSKVSFIY